MIHEKGTKLDPPLRLDMNSDEALERFLATDPKEVEKSVERSKKKGPEQEGDPARPPRKKR